MAQYNGSFQYTYTNGVAPITFSISEGALPTGLSMDSSGLVTGNTSTLGHYNWTVRAIDSVGHEAYLLDSAYVMDIVSAPPGGEVGDAYSYSFISLEGLAPYTYVLESGTLPAGLTLSSAGVLSGIPTTEASYSFVIRVTDVAGITTTHDYDINIGAAVDEGVGTIIMPGFDGGEYDIIRASSHDAAAGLELVIFNNGTWAVRRTISVAPITTEPPGMPVTGSWNSVNGAGVGDTYQVRAIGSNVIVGNYHGTTTLPLDSGWITLTSDQNNEAVAFATSALDGDNTQVSTLELDIYFREVGGVPTIMAHIKLLAEAEAY